MHACIYAHVYAHAHTHTHTHASTHAHTQSCYFYTLQPHLQSCDLLWPSDIMTPGQYWAQLGFWFHDPDMTSLVSIPQNGPLSQQVPSKIIRTFHPSSFRRSFPWEAITWTRNKLNSSCSSRHSPQCQCAGFHRRPAQRSWLDCPAQTPCPWTACYAGRGPLCMPCKQCPPAIMHGHYWAVVLAVLLLGYTVIALCCWLWQFPGENRVWETIRC